MKYILFIFFSILLSTHGSSQDQNLIENSPKEDNFLIKPANVYGTFGSIIFGFAGSANAEYLFLNTRNIKLGPKISFGGVAITDFFIGFSAGAFYSPGASLLIGKDRISINKNSFFVELNYGYLSFVNDFSEGDYLFAGLRLYEPSGRIFRMGIGFPELLQVSVGQSF